MDNAIIMMKVMARVEVDPDITGSLLMTGCSPMGGTMHLCRTEENSKDFQKVYDFLREEEIPFQVYEGMDTGPAKNQDRVKSVLIKMILTAEGISSASFSEGIGHILTIEDGAKNTEEVLKIIKDATKDLFESDENLNRVVIMDEQCEKVLKVLKYEAKVIEDVPEEGRPQRDTNITEDEVTNLIISLNQEMDVEDFIKTLEG